MSLLSAVQDFLSGGFFNCCQSNFYASTEEWQDDCELVVDYSPQVGEAQEAVQKAKVLTKKLRSNSSLDTTLPASSCAASPSNSPRHHNSVDDFGAEEVMKALKSAQTLIEDIRLLDAEQVLAEAQHRLSTTSGCDEHLKELMESEIYKNVVHRVSQFDATVDMLFNADMEVLYESEHGRFDVYQPPGMPTVFDYRMTVSTDAPLSESLSTGVEVDLFQGVVPMVSSTPIDLRSPSAHLMAVMVKFGVMMFRTELLFEAFRVRGGANSDCLVECVSSEFKLPDGKTGPKAAWMAVRPWISTANMWLPRGGGNSGTVLVQVCRVDTQIKVPQSVLNFVFRQLASTLMQNLREGSLKAIDKDSTWAQRIAEDKMGLYAKMRDVEQNAALRKEVTSTTLPGREIFDRPWRLKPKPRDMRPPSAKR